LRFAASGGAPGALGISRIERADGRMETLAQIGSAAMEPGDVFVIETLGGGGYGADA
jgi:5-oxoprolinase (ATP-hydrolysing)